MTLRTSCVPVPGKVIANTIKRFDFGNLRPTRIHAGDLHFLLSIFIFLLRS